MKQLLLALTIITGLAACKSNADDSEKTGAVQLLPAVAAYNNNASSDTNSSLATIPQKEASRTITKIVYVTKKAAPVIDRDPTPPIEPQVPVATPIAPTLPTSETNGTVTAPANGTINDNKDITSTVPETVKKKGWSSAAKGAAIGAGTGAIGGIILSKKKGLGAVVGGVVGAAGGYIIGKNIDKKNAGK